MITASRPCRYPGCPNLSVSGGKCKQHQLKVTVVYGPPGSGKTTYVQQHKQVGDIVWDYDVILSTLCGTPLGEKQPDCVGVLTAMRMALVLQVGEKTPCRPVWIIVTREESAREIAHITEAELVRCEVSEAERQRRLAARHEG